MLAGVTARDGRAATRNMPKSLLPFGRRLLSRTPGGLSAPQTPWAGGTLSPRTPGIRFVRVASGISLQHLQPPGGVDDHYRRHAQNERAYSRAGGGGHDPAK